MRTVTNFRRVLLCSLACLPGITDATVFLAPTAVFGPEDEVRLDEVR